LEEVGIRTDATGLQCEERDIPRCYTRAADMQAPAVICSSLVRFIALRDGSWAAQKVTGWSNHIGLVATQAAGIAIEMETLERLDQPSEDSRPSDDTRVLHVIVGHKLRNHLLNAVDSVVALAKEDDLLVIDNASRDERLDRALKEIASRNSQVQVWHRSTNDVSQNPKVGGLYGAYEEAFWYADSQLYDYVHLLQGDMQLVWWRREIVKEADRLFKLHPSCVNIVTLALSRDKSLGDELRFDERTGSVLLTKYGMTDTGLYHMRRWRSSDLEFGPSEQAHARRALDRGIVAVLHPWPCVVPVPWPPAIRHGKQRGADPERRKPFFCRPLDEPEIAGVRSSSTPEPLETVCVPWGWWCLTPMWVSDLADPGYWILRYKGAKQNGLAAGVPRIDRRGIPGAGWLALVANPHRPSFVALFIRPANALVHVILQRWAASARTLARRLLAGRLPDKQH